MKTIEKEFIRETAIDIILDFEHRHLLPEVTGGSWRQIERAREIRERILSEAGDWLCACPNAYELQIAFDFLKKQVLATWWLGHRESTGLATMSGVLEEIELLQAAA